MTSRNPGSSKSRQPRYLVNPMSGMKITIPQSHLRQHPLATLGYGGFGIYCSHKESKLLRLNEIDVVMSIGSERVQLRGHIQYFKCLPQARPDVYYVGIKLESDSDKRRNWRDLVDVALHKGYLAKPLV